MKLELGKFLNGEFKALEPPRCMQCRTTLQLVESTTNGVIREEVHRCACGAFESWLMGPDEKGPSDGLASVGTESKEQS